MLIGAELRPGSCGVWHHVTDPEGRPRGALRVDPTLLAPPGALPRLVAIVMRVRAANPDGVVPVVDLVQLPAEDGEAIWLITSSPAERTLADLEPGDEATDALRQVGRTLHALHAADLAHGALSASTVVLGPAGRVLLAEVGMRAAMSGTSADPASDLRDFAALVRAFAGPEDERVRADRTMVGRRGTTTAVAPLAEGVDIRFGPGVPAADSSAVTAGSPGIARRSRRRRVRRWASVVITAAVIGGVAFWWWHRLGGIRVESASVSSAPSVVGCAATADVVAVVDTNGRRGVLRYRWVRNDGQTTDELSQTIAGGQRSVTLHLAWTFAGRGNFAAVATLDIRSPDPITAQGHFRYRC